MKSGSFSIIHTANSQSLRNEMIEKSLKTDSNSEFKNLKIPEGLKTGTTIVGLMFKDGVIIGADTRATAGTTVFIKNCEKI